jgi:hypothetical protein
MPVLTPKCSASLWVALFAVVVAQEARAESSPAPGPASAAPPPWRASGVVSIGRGLRFNNPYRLATPLGESAESISLSASYLELSAAVLRELSGGFRHGGSLSGAFALQGIEQLGVTPSYLLELQYHPRAAARARIGVPFVVAPDATAGLEAAIGQSLEIAWGIGVLAELVGSVFFGAATEETAITTIPMLSLQLGLSFQHPVAF